MSVACSGAENHYITLAKFYFFSYLGCNFFKLNILLTLILL